MAQRQIGRKHRKIRLLRERYPHVRLKLFTRRALTELWARFGLSGTSLDPDLARA